MDSPTTNFVRAGSLEELKAKGQLVVRGPHRPILVGVRDPEVPAQQLEHRGDARLVVAHAAQQAASCDRSKTRSA